MHCGGIDYDCTAGQMQNHATFHSDAHKTLFSEDGAGMSYFPSCLTTSTTSGTLPPQISDVTRPSCSSCSFCHMIKTKLVVRSCYVNLDPTHTLPIKGTKKRNYDF